MGLTSQLISFCQPVQQSSTRLTQTLYIFVTLTNSKKCFIPSLSLRIMLIRNAQEKKKKKTLLILFQLH